MGFAFAQIAKIAFLKKLPKISVFACQSCNTLASVKVFKDHIEIVRCKC